VNKTAHPVVPPKSASREINATAIIADLEMKKGK